MMHKRNLIEDNKRGENQSFLYFLHEEKKFDVKALDDFSKISNLPFDYWEYIEPFERLVACLYEGESKEG